MMLKLVDAALLCACASPIISVIAVALPYWFYAQTTFRWGTLITYSGLWTTCNQTVTARRIGKAVCRNIVEPNGPHYIVVTRAFELIGLLLVAFAVILGLLKLLEVLRDRLFLSIAGGIAAAAGCCMILGAIIFGAMSVPLFEKVTLHIGFYFALFSGVFALGGGIVFLACKSD